MNKRRAVAIMALVMIGLVGFAGSLYASTTGVNWYATDGDVNMWNISSESDVYIQNGSGDQLLLYDYGTGTSYTITVTQNSSGIYTAYNGATSGTTSINLGTTGYFDFYIAGDGVITYTEVKEDKLYVLTSPSGDKVLTIDAAPVPIPGSALLLGSGLLGLVGIGLRRQRS